MSQTLKHTIILASRNPAKLELFRPALDAYGLTMQGLADPDRPPVPETAATPEGNALLKAQAAWVPGQLVFADDAGMEVDALGGEPGVQTRRWGGRFPADIDDQTWLQYLLARLAEVPLARRTARFVSGWALVGPDGRQAVHRVVTPFLIAEREIQPMTPGFPVSAVQIRPAGQEQDPQRLVRRELAAWPFFQQLLTELRCNFAAQSPYQPGE